MSTLLKNARKNKIWYLLATSTGYSKSYCKKVMIGERNKEAKGATVIVNKYNELEKLLSNEN